METEMTLEQRIEAIESKVDEILTLAKQHFAPMPNLELKEIARQLALGNKEPLRKRNERYKKGLIK